MNVAYGINDKGWIVGYGDTSDNLTAAFVAVPEGRGEQAQAVQPQPQSQHRGQGQQVSESNEGDYDVFYTRLSSEEGSWVEAGNYGYCFRRRVSGDWRPYRDGHWVWTDHGWYWDSNERFAWATYHSRPMGQYWWDRMVLGSRKSMGSGLGLLGERTKTLAGLLFRPKQTSPWINRYSSWSDSYYDIGPAPYAFISYSHWHEPTYAQYIQPPERNVQIISETKKRHEHCLQQQRDQ